MSKAGERLLKAAAEMRDIAAYPYIYRWDRQGRKGQSCRVTARAKVMNSCCVEFPDGYMMITSRNSLRYRREDE